MRLSQYFMPTLRETPSGADIDSHQLMLRAGLIRPVASGIYSYLPLGYRVYRKIEKIVREEMDASGAQEVIMPALLPSEAYQASGRWEVFGQEMFRLKDRNNRDFCLGPTHEEIFALTVKNETKSYRDLPIILYQIQHKYRDEKRPRFGVIRSREFVMKDAYSFDRDEEGLNISYEKMAKAYKKIFDRCSLDYIVVEADSRAMGGSGSQEFMVRSDVGEDFIVFCDSCGYAANLEKAEMFFSKDKELSDPGDRNNGDLPGKATPSKIHTPDVKTIEELMGFLNLRPDVFVKSLIYMADEEPILVMVRGDRELNETKLINKLNLLELEMADARTVEEITGAEVGYAGPINLKKKIKIICDREVEVLKNFVVGANETEYHIKDVNYGADFEADLIADLINVTPGDPCPVCQKPLDVCKGIETGHIFKLGTKYSKSLNCVYLDENGQENPMLMGSYGIGINRTMAAIIEQNNDKDGIIWPIAVAPFLVAVIPVNTGDETIYNLAEEIYGKLLDMGIEVLIDDRDERPGVKFKDNELTGIPFRITVGRRASERIVEFKKRNEENKAEMNVEEVLETVSKLLSPIK